MSWWSSVGVRPYTIKRPWRNGRRAGFRSRSLRGCGFESLRPHYEMRHLTLGSVACHTPGMTTTTNTEFTSESAVFGHVSEETAYLVDDYPYGFRLRTQIRYWLETTKSGDRFVSQTLNPKTGRWNKPKKSTYVQVGAMYLDAEGHMTWTGLHYHANEDAIRHFMDVTNGHLSPAQRQHLALVVGMNRAMKDVTFEIRPGTMTDEERAEQAQINRAINRRVVGEASAALRNGEV
jgi:hypothetical protein